MTTEVTLRGSIPLRAKDYATEKIDMLARFSPFPLLHSRVRLTQATHRAAGRQVIAEMNVDVNGRLVRVQVAGASSHEAIDRAQGRLRRKLSQLGRHPAHSGGRQRLYRPSYAVQPQAERQVLRHKAYEPAVTSADEAVFDLELMDYDFQLFHDADTGVDSVVYRDTPHGYRLTRLEPAIRATAPAALITVDRAPAARMTLAAAIGTLEAAAAPFVFFADAGTGRGNVLYRRHDGHYGLITPAV